MVNAHLAWIVYIAIIINMFCENQGSLLNKCAS